MLSDVFHENADPKCENADQNAKMVTETGKNGEMLSGTTCTQ
jgi:hypothetical protein